MFQPSCWFWQTNFLLRDDRADRNDSTQSSGNEFGTRGHFRSVRRRLQVREERIPEKFEENQLVDSKKVVAEREKWWIKVKKKFFNYSMNLFIGSHLMFKEKLSPFSCFQSNENKCKLWSKGVKRGITVKLFLAININP